MHKIERLLQTLAPKGVEFRKLGDMTISFTKQTGFDYSAFIKPTLIKEYLPNYIPFIQNKDFLGHYINYKTDYFIPNEIAIRFPQILLNEKCLLISISGSIGKVAVFNHSQDAFIGGAIAVLKFKEKKSLDFVMHFLMSASGQKLLLNGVKSGSHKNLTIADLKKITIPIPPLEIQQEIVKILDAFTELNTELNARKKQYEYYQNMLLDFNDINQNRKDAKMSAKAYPKRLQTLLQTLAPKGVEFKTLEEVFEIKNGYTPSKNNPEFWKNGTIPWFRMEDIRENGRILKDSIQHITPKALKGKKLFPKNSIIISTTATIGEHALLIVDSLANQRFTFLSKKANCDLALDMKFFFYQCFLLGEWCKKNTNVSGFASVDMTAFKKYKFPIPPLEIQQEIVKILDQFSLLTTDLLAGIPAEIKARKKQYEYYREKLLTFKPLKA